MPSISRGTPPGVDTFENFLTDMMPADAWHVSQWKSTDFGTLTTIPELQFGVTRQLHVLKAFNFVGNATW